VPYSILNSILPLPAEPNFIDLQNQKDVLIQCSILRDQDLQGLNNINYILSHPDQFIDPEKFPLGQIRNDLDADLNMIAAAASNALNHPKEVALPQFKLAGPIELPKRKAGLPPLVTVPNVVGMDEDHAKVVLQAAGLQVTVTFDGT
jgi:hypothetical protein